MIANYTHASASYPGAHQRRLLCADCHKGDYVSFPWPNAAYRPDCAACHSGKYASNKHIKTDSSNTYYTVSELRDCSGSCHFTDGSGNLITRSGKHSLSQW
jgi:hypothetical protein